MITLQSHALRLSIVPDIGAGITDFSVRSPSGDFTPLMRRAAPNESNASNFASFIMAPWVNRIRSGTFPFNNKHYAIRTTTPDGMAQHGDVRKRPWRVTQKSRNSIVCEFDSTDFKDTNWPWPFAARALFTLLGTDNGGTLRIDLLIRNLASEPMPAACGHHPYFMRRLWNAADDLQIQVPVAARYPLESGCATGPASEDNLTRRLRTLAPIPTEPIDSVFAAFPASVSPPNTATLRWPSSSVTLRIAASASMSHWVVYAPHEKPTGNSPLPFIALEPQTAVNDALNLGAKGIPNTGTVALQPNEELATTCTLEVEVG
jgi:aldose 1-epimerase